MLNFILLLIIFVFIVTKDVKAYLDPGSGSYLLQILFASFFSLMLIIKTFWKKIAIFLKQTYASTIGKWMNAENEKQEWK